MNPETMRAMVLRQPGRPLELTELPRPRPTADQVLLRVECCAVCRTDLHILDGELREPKLPLIPAIRSSESWSRMRRRTLASAFRGWAGRAESVGRLTGTAILSVQSVGAPFDQGEGAR